MCVTSHDYTSICGIADTYTVSSLKKAPCLHALVVWQSLPNSICDACMQMIASEMELLDTQYNCSFVLKLSMDPGQVQLQPRAFQAAYHHGLVTRVMAVEYDAQTSTAYLIPTYSRFKRRIPYHQPADDDDDAGGDLVEEMFVHRDDAVQ